MDHRRNPCEQIRNLAARNGRAEEVALNLHTASAGECIELLLCLHALRSGCHPKFDAKAGHSSHDRTTIGSRSQLANERLVDLDPVEWEPPQIAQRRIAGAE